MKRFWKQAGIATLGDEYAVELDGRPVKLPSGKMLTTPFRTLAEAIAQEWEDAAEVFTPENLPLTRLASTAQERIAPHRANIIGQLAAYGMNDVLCYRAGTPNELVARQSDIWGHWLRWGEATYKVHLVCTTGLVPIDQPPGTREAFERILSSYSSETIAALGVIVPALGSLILGLALTAKALAPRAACAAAFLDELWQEEQWGADDEAAVRHSKIIADIEVSARFMDLCAG